MRQQEDNPRLREVFQTIGANIIRLRTGAGMSQKDLATNSGVGRSTIIAVESGEPCNLSNLLKIADALHVSPADLFITNKDRQDINYKTKLLCDRLSELLKIQ